MSKQEEQEVQEMNEERVSENITYCPECERKGKVSCVVRQQYEEGRYWVACTSLKDGCYFLEEYEGNIRVTKEDLIKYGFPDQLAEHMDILYKDIGKISRLCMSEYIKTRYLGSTTTVFDFDESVRILSEAHGLGVSQTKETIKTGVCDVRANEDLVRTITEPHGLQSVNECKQPTKKSNESESGVQGDLVGPLDLEDWFGFNPSSMKIKTDEYDYPVQGELVGTTADLKDFESFCQFFQPAEEFKPYLTGNDDVVNKFEDSNCFNQSLQLLQINDEELTSLEDGEDKILHRLTCDSMREFAESLVEDLPIHYQEKVKIAFSKIKGYTFPDDYLNKMNTLNKISLFKILEKRERAELIKSEVDEQLQKFMADMCGLKDLLQ